MPAPQSKTSASQVTGQPETILRARGLGKSFRMGDATIQVLKGCDLSLRRGEFVAIEGRSGSGKSTLLHILGALDSADGGTVEFNGVDYTTSTQESPRPRHLLRPRSWYQFIGAMQWVSLIISGILAVLIGLFWALRLLGTVWEWLSFLGAVPVMVVNVGLIVIGVLLGLAVLTAIVVAVMHYLRERPQAELRSRTFGFVFQFYHLLPELNVLENTLLSPMVEHSWWGFRKNARATRQRAVDLLTQLGLGHRLGHRPSQLSGGERQRVAIARALMNDPQILFADEPTGNLDVETGRQIMEVLEKLHRERGQTIVMVTHDRSLARQADRVLVLRDGKLEKAD